MALNGNKLGKELYDALELESEINEQEGMDQPAKLKAKSKALNKQKAIGNAVVQHIVDNLELLGIKVALDSTSVQTTVNTTVTATVTPGIGVQTVPVTGTGATITPGAASGAGSGAGQGEVIQGGSTQTNDGKGLVK